MAESTGQWLEKALIDLCQKMETGLGLDTDMISGLVSYCELAHPRDAKEYLDNIIGQEAGKPVTEEYLRRRGHIDPYGTTQNVPNSQLQAYVKPPSEKGSVNGTKKPLRTPKVVAVPSYQTEAEKNAVSSHQDNRVSAETSELKSMNKRNQISNSKKKKAGKVVSLAEAAKGSIVFQQGKPCSCQARQHRLISNCLSCGKIVCEQEGEGPCNFCGALVLREGSQYAGLDESLPLISDAEAAAEAYAKRLVEYDRNSAARTTVIDDQSDYYEIEGNSWLSMEEKELLRKKREEIEEEEKAKRSRVVVTFDLVGRKVLVNKDEVEELKSESGILRPPDERESNRIKPNPTLKVQPIFMDPGPIKNPVKNKQPNKTRANTGFCLEITGRVQHESNELKHFMTNNQLETDSNGKFWQGPSSSSSVVVNDDGECSLDYQ
ncbi:Zinc finger, C2HC5-type [Trema orientale]|uniref:Zinc finger, C2HC5-type n=1 Tax=Trema orientale TaxID=63057 RepID=A0A2P5F758_TREOI|nr:Zinc finger, C2HC5-type [Trema orientale]